MCRVVSLELSRSTWAVAEARTFVRDTLRRWELESLAADAMLLTSELVTNSVLHAASDVTVTVAVAEGIAEVGITDGSDALPKQRTGSARAEHEGEGGRGLRLVELVAQEWGVVSLPGGKQVWFRLDVGTEWPHRTDCPCAGEDLDRVRLESGRYAIATPGPWDVDEG
jgi:anti-sigma regulatory factor (Ser/Thr protein kinase)